MTAEIEVTTLATDATTVRASETLLSSAERTRAGRFVFEADRRRFIIGRARLRQFLAERLAARPQSIEIEYGPHGKPALSKRFAASNLRFNLSHCGDLAVYAFAAGRDVGVDVEAVRWMADAGDVAARFFSPQENQELRSLDVAARSHGFFNCWTRKEAFIKAVGDGLSYPLDSFDVTLTPGLPAQLFRVGGWIIESLEPAPGFVGALVTRTD